MSYTWAPVQPGQVADDGAINALGAAVTAHDASILALNALAPVYANRQLLSTPQPTIAFSGIPASLRQLMVTWTARTDAAVATQLAFFQVNADANPLYTYTYSQILNTTPTGGGNRSQTTAFYGSLTGASAGAGLPGTGTIFFQNWDSLTFGLGYTFTNQAMGAAAASQVHMSGGGTYLQTTTPRTSLLFIPGAGNFIAGTDFQLIGWAT